MDAAHRGATALVESGQAPVQARGSVDATDPATVHRAAAAGVSGSGSALPHFDRIQESFGAAHDLGQVSAHVGGEAAAASETMGAEAYATGNHLAFRSQPDLHTAAHEAAHVVQQRAGVHLKSGVGAAGDTYERNADEVADRVVQGRPAADLLPAPGGGVTGVQQTVQRYTKVTGMPYDRVSDDGKLAAVDHGREAWAESSKIASSNKILDEHHSKAKIEELSSGAVSVAPPGAVAGAAVTKLEKFRMVDRATGSEVELRDDCGTANQQMLGSEHHGTKEFVAANTRGTTQEFTGAESYHGDDHAPGGIVSTTEALSGQIYIRIFEREFGKTLNRTDALKEWAKLVASSPADAERLSKKYGINKHAVPQVGQGITIGSERDMPGAVPGGYNFHFALNLMMSGPDYITLEDYDSSGVKYYFDMYGPESKGQSFAEDPGNTGALGNKTTTMVVEHPQSLEGTINANSTSLVEDPALMNNPRILAKGDQVTIQRKGHSWMKVTVKSGKQSGQIGWIMNKFFDQ